MRIVNMIWAIPTWLLVIAMVPILPKKHPWKGTIFSLEDWTRGRTDSTKIIDSIFYMNNIFLVLLILN